MSPTDAMFLLAESPTHPMHVGAVQVFAPPPGRDARDVAAAFDVALATAEMAAPLRRRATRSVSSLGQWSWQPDPHYRVENHVHRHTMPQPADRDALLALCSRLHSGILDRSRPLWEMHLIGGLADGRYAVYTKMHHAVADGVAAMRMLQDSLSADPEQRGMSAAGATVGQPRPQPTRHGANLPSAGLARRLPATLAHAAGMASGEAVGLVGALAGTLDRAVREHAGALSLSAPRSTLNVPITPARQFTARSWPIQRLRRVAQSREATINDVVLAMCSGALRAYLRDRDTLPEAPLIAMVPVSLRTEPQRDDSEQRDDGRLKTRHDDHQKQGGNKVGVLMCSLATHLDAPAARLTAVRDMMADGKRSMRALSPTQILATSALGVSTLALSLLPGYSRLLKTGILRPAFNIVISNVPGPTGPRYWNGARLDELYPLSIATHGQALNITCTSTDDQIAFGLTGCPDSMPDLHQLTDYLDIELNALEHTSALGGSDRRPASPFPPRTASTQSLVG